MLDNSYFSVFCSDTIFIYSDAPGTMYHGTLQPGEETITELNCDIQPASRNLAHGELGYYIDADWVIFSEINENIKMGAEVEFTKHNITFAGKIVKIVPWDLYNVFYVKE